MMSLLTSLSSWFALFLTSYFMYHHGAVADSATVSSSSSSSSSSQTSLRVLQSNSNGDFQALNDRWYDTIEVQLDNITITPMYVLSQPLIVTIDTTTCQHFAVGDISWMYAAAIPNELDSNLTIQDFSVYCAIEYSWEYNFLGANVGTTGQAEIYISNNSNVATSFQLILPSNTNEQQYQLVFDQCQPNVYVDALNFLGNSPIDAVLNVLRDLLSGSITTSIEQYMCTFITQLQDGFQSLLNKYTASIHNMTKNAPNYNTGSDPLVAYEQSMNISKNVSLINLYHSTNDDNTSSSSIAQMIDLISQFSGISIFVDDGKQNDTSSHHNSNNTEHGNQSSKLWNTFFRDNIAPDGGVVISLQNNTLLNGNRSLLHSFVVRNNNTNSSSTNGTISIYDLVQFAEPYRTIEDDDDPTTAPGIFDIFFGIQDMTVTNATIYGLQDALRSFDGIQILGNYTVGIDISILNDMKFMFDTKVQRINYNKNSTANTELVQMGFNTSQIQLKAGILIAIDNTILNSIELGSLLYDTSTTISCLSSTLYEPIQITGLDLMSYDINTIYFDGLETVGMERLMTTVSQYALDAIRPTMNTVLSRFLIGYDILSLFIPKKNDTQSDNNETTSSSDTCPNPVNGTNDPYIDFRDLLLPAAMAKQYGGSGTAPYGNLISNVVQDIIPSLLDYTNFTISGVVFNYTTTFQLGKDSSASFGSFVFALHDFRFENQGLLIPSDANHTLLQAVPNQPHVINNTLALGNTMIRGNMELSYDLDNTDHDPLTRNVFDLTIDFHTFTALLTILAEAREQSFLEFPLQDIFNIHCWLALFPQPTLNDDGINVYGANGSSLSFLDFNITMDGVYLNITCYECTPALQAASDAIRPYDFTNDVRKLIQQLIQLIIINKDNTNINSPPVSIFQRELDRIIYDAPKNCPHDPQYNASYRDQNFVNRLINAFIAPDSYIANNNNSNNSTKLNKSAINLIIGVVVSGCCIVICIMLFIWVNKKFVTRRFHHMVQQLPPEELVIMMNEQIKYNEKQDQLNLYSHSLYRNEHNIIPTSVRYGLPILLIISSVCFWCGLFIYSMTVKFYFSIMDYQSATPTPIATYPIVRINYSLAGLAGQWWNRGAKLLAVTCILSILWPQTKLLITMILYFISTSKVTVAKRGFILKLLDFFSKWSIIVIFIVIISTSIFQGTIEAKFYQFEFIYVPIGGMYAIIVGQIISEIASKLVLHYHNCVIESFEQQDNIKTTKSELKTPSTQSFQPTGEIDLDEIESSISREAQVAGDLHKNNDCIVRDNEEQIPSSSSSSNDRYALWSSKFTRPHRGDCGKLHIRPIVRYGYLLLGLVAIIMVLLGFVLASFSYDISGLLGVALNFGHENEDNSTGTNSVVTMISSLMESARLLDQGKYSFGLGFISLFLILTVLVVPIIEFLILLAQWSLPMQQRSFLRWQLILCIMESWQCMEVYFVAVIATALSVSGVSKFFTETYCSTLSSLLQSLVYWGFLNESDDQCINMEATIHPSTLVFIIGYFILFFMKTFVNDAIRHRVQEENNQLQLLKTNSSDTPPNAGDMKVNIDELQPPPLHFTDRFRWALKSDSICQIQK